MPEPYKTRRHTDHGRPFLARSADWLMVGAFSAVMGVMWLVAAGVALAIDALPF